MTQVSGQIGSSDRIGSGQLAPAVPTLTHQPAPRLSWRTSDERNHRHRPAARSRDSADLAQFGYRQELKRSLGVFSSFAVAFSYISPSTGIFTLFSLGLTTIGGAFFWTWPIVAAGQFIIALNFAEVSSHYPIAGSVFQWTKYLAGRSYAWFSGWIYLFAGILTVTSVVATLPLALIPTLERPRLAEPAADLAHRAGDRARSRSW